MTSFLCSSVLDEKRCVKLISLTCLLTKVYHINLKSHVATKGFGLMTIYNERMGRSPRFEGQRMECELVPAQYPHGKWHRASRHLRRLLT